MWPGHKRRLPTQIHFSLCTGGSANVACEASDSLVVSLAANSLRYVKPMFCTSLQ